MNFAGEFFTYSFPFRVGKESRAGGYVLTFRTRLKIPVVATVLKNTETTFEIVVWCYGSMTDFPIVLDDRH